LRRSRPGRGVARVGLVANARCWWIDLLGASAERESESEEKRLGSCRARNEGPAAEDEAADEVEGRKRAAERWAADRRTADEKEAASMAGRGGFGSCWGDLL
jgi:hypothetical protein